MQLADFAHDYWQLRNSTWASYETLARIRSDRVFVGSCSLHRSGNVGRCRDLRNTLCF